MKKHFAIAGVLVGLISLSLPFAYAGFKNGNNKMEQTYAVSADFDVYSYNASTSSFNQLYTGTDITDFSSAISKINTWGTGGKIVLKNNITIPGNHWVTKRLVLDLNGHNITVNDSSKAFVLGYRDGMAKGTQVNGVLLTGTGMITGNVRDSVLLLDGTGSDHSYTASDVCLLNVTIDSGVHIKHTGSSGRAIFINEGATVHCEAGSYIESTTSHGIYSAGGACSVFGRVEGSGATGIYDVYLGATPASEWYGCVYLKGDSCDVDNVLITYSSCKFDLVETYTSLNPLRVVWSPSIPHNDTWYPLNHVSTTFKNNFKNYLTLEFQSSQHYTLSWVDVSTSYGRIKATINNYQIKYNANGGTGIGVTDTVKALENYTVRECMFTHSGYVSFKRWNTSPDDTGTYYDGNEYIDDGVTQSMTLYAIWVKYDHNYFDEFSIEYLHMEDYDPDLHVGAEGDNYCKDVEHHYYEDAKDYFENTMSKSQRVSFPTYLSGQYADAWARFNAWANANGETITLVDGDYVISSNRYISPITAIKTNITVVAIVASISALLISSTLFFTLKKKKKEQ